MSRRQQRCHQRRSCRRKRRRLQASGDIQFDTRNRDRCLGRGRDRCRARVARHQRPMGAAPAGVDQQARDSVRHGVQCGPDDGQCPESRPVVLFGEAEFQGDAPRMQGPLPVDHQVGVCCLHESVTVGIPPAQGRQLSVQHLDGPVLHNDRVRRMYDRGQQQVWARPPRMRPSIAPSAAKSGERSRPQGGMDGAFSQALPCRRAVSADEPLPA